jgi:hypothetical protein
VNKNVEYYGFRVGRGSEIRPLGEMTEAEADKEVKRRVWELPEAIRQNFTSAVSLWVQMDSGEWFDVCHYSASDFEEEPPARRHRYRG